MASSVFLDGDTAPRVLSFVVPGKPVPKGRPRFGKGRTYTPAETRDYEALVRARVIDAKRSFDMGDLECLEGPVAVSIRIYEDREPPFVVVAVSALGPKKSRTWRGDIDNVGKAILDGLQSFRLGGKLIPGLIGDDSQVVQLSVEVEA